MEPLAIPSTINIEYYLVKLVNFIIEVLSYIFSIEFLGDLKAFVTIVVILLIASILYSLVRLYEMKDEDAKKEAAANKNAQVVAPEGVSAAGAANPVWESIRTKLLSESQSEWRLAIIEADIYMDRMLDAKGFIGETVGDKLKGLNATQLPSLQSAWEAHKVRNTIAHEGADYVLTFPQVRQTLAQYEAVLRDLGVIA